MALLHDNQYKSDPGPGTLATAASTNITLDAGFRLQVEEYGGRDTNGIHRTKIVMPSTAGFSFATTSASLGIGQKVYTFPTGVIVPLGASVCMKSTATTANGTAGEVGLGSVVASGAVSVLSGTSTFNNFMKGQTLSNHVAGTQLTSKKFATGGSTSGTELALDGTGTAIDLYLNLASAWDAIGSVHVDQLEITLLWAYMRGVFTT